MDKNKPKKLSEIITPMRVKNELLNIGDEVILDKGYSTECKVTITHLSSNKMFSIVTSGTSEWTVMSNRLTKE